MSFTPANDKPFERADGRRPDELRPVRLTPDFMPYAEGSALVEVGNTKVICTATLEERVPPFRRNTGQPYCRAVVAPKVAKFRQQFAGRLRGAE